MVLINAVHNPFSYSNRIALHIFKTDYGRGGYKKFPPRDTFGRKLKHFSVCRATFRSPGGRSKGALSPQLHGKRIIIGSSAKAIDQDVVEGLEIGQLSQEGDHVRGRAHVAKLTQEPGHRQDDSFVLQMLLLELVDLEVGVMDD